jgi:mono/diheme cytochrome c family protein
MSSKFLASIFLSVITFSPPPLAAQQENTSLTPAQLQAASLFKQRCGVCHLPTIVGKVNGQTVVMRTRLYGPALSKDTVIGKEDAVRQQMMQGTPRMPGFQYGLTPAQITSIIEYLKTVEKPLQVGFSSGSADDDQ